MKKIIIIGPIPPPYIGPSIATKLLLTSELTTKFSLFHLDTSHHKTVKTLGKKRGSSLVTSFLHIIRLVKLIKNTNPHAIYLPISQTLIGFLRDSGFILVSKFRKKRVIIHLRGSYFRKMYERFNYFLKLWVKFVMKKVDYTIVLDKKLKPIFLPFMDEDRIKVVPNGVKLMKRILKPKTNLLKVIYLSNLIKEKGVMDLFSALPSIVERCPQVEFIFAGEMGLSKKEIKQVKKISNLPKLKGKVKILPPVIGRKKEVLLGGGDVFVLPSYNEGAPWVILEAMSAGLSIVATDVGVIKEIIEEGGITVRVGDVKGLGDAIVKLLKEEKRRKEMGEKNRKKIKNKYNEKKFVENMEKIFSLV